MRTLQAPLLVIVICLRTALLAGQTPNAPSKPSADASKQGVALQTDLTVQGNVTVQAVLIPRKIAKAIFGGKIADEYAVVQLTINNKSSDAALIVQGVYIDYSKWALAGGGFSKQPCTEADPTDPLSKFTHCTQSTQVASEEYRVVRGQALNAQTWTWRNGIMRGLTLAGSVASAYAFTVSGTKYPKAVAGATGTFVPGLGTFWPDQTIDQINRISDLGYQTNKVISKQGSDVIVCFFPIDRFLTRGFKKVFLDDPALFLSPFEMLVDRKIKMQAILPNNLFGSVTPDEMRAALPCYLFNSHTGPTPAEPPSANQQTLATYCATNGPSPNVVAALETLKHVSLNTIVVVIDGVMTVDTTALQPKIQSVTIDGEDTNATLWTGATADKPATINGTIKGAYLTGAHPIIQGAKDLGISSVSVDGSASDDQTLRFSFQLTKPLTVQQLTFVVEKPTKDSKTAPIDSTPYLYQVKQVPAKSGGGDGTTGTGKTGNEGNPQGTKPPTLTTGEGTTPTTSPSQGGPGQPKIDYVRSRPGRPGNTGALLTVYGENLDKISDVETANPDALRIRGHLPSPDASYLVIAIEVLAKAKPGTYKIQLYEGKSKVAEEPFEVREF